MNINRTVSVAAALWLTAAAATFASSAQMGTWKLNESKSKFAPDATKNNTVTYTAAKHGMTTVTVDGVDKDGKSIHWTWEGKFNGKPYKAENNPTVDTIAYKRVSDRTNKLTMMKDGKTVITVMITVAKDGKSRTVTSTPIGGKGKNETDMAYYDKE